MPVLGNSLAFLRDTTGFLVGAYREYGPIFRIRMLWVRFTVILGFEAREFLANGGERHLTRHPVFDPVGRQLGASDFALAVSGDTHLELRRLLQIAYSREVASPFVPQFVTAVQSVVRGWKSGAVHEVFESVQELAFEQYCQVMAGESWHPHYRDCRLVTDTNMKVGGRVRPMLLFHWPPYRAARQRVLNLAAASVARQRQHPQPSAHATIIDTLISVRFPDGRPMSDEDIYCYALYGLPGSCSYMGRLIAFMLYEILRRRELKAELVSEADQAFAQGLSNGADVADLRILRSVYHETLRFHPVSQGMPYMAREDFDFNGFHVPSGSMVVLSQLPMLFSEEPFKDPHRFDPARCQEPRNEHRKLGAFNPFGMHQRTCAAMGLVELMALTLVATLLHEVDLEIIPADYQLRRSVQPLPAPDSHFRMRITSRIKPSPTQLDHAPLREEVFLATFPGADQPEIVSVLENAQYQEFHPGNDIVRQGDAADAFYIIASGRVEVLRSNASGQQERVAILSPGDFFGETGLLFGLPRNATVRVLDEAPVRALVLTGKMFQSIVSTSDLLSSELAAVARKRMARDRLRELVRHLSVQKLSTQLGKFCAEAYRPGTRILNQGAEPDRFYILVSGEVEVLQRGDRGEERVVATLSAGDYFGEVGLLNNSPRNASVLASGGEGITAYSCDRVEFEKLVREAGGRNGDLALSLLKRLS